MTYIYGIFAGDKAIYIGSTDDYIRRFKEHRRALEKGKHSNKTLQKYINQIGLDKVEFKVVKELNIDNSLLRYFAEMLSISFYKPKCNRAVIQQGRSRIILQRCDKDIAERLLKCIGGDMNNG